MFDLKIMKLFAHAIPCHQVPGLRSRSKSEEDLSTRISLLLSTVSGKRP